MLAKALDKNYNNVKSLCEHVFLYMGLVVYTAIGARIFQALESPVEEEKMEELQGLVMMERENFLRFILNGSWNSNVHRNSIDRKLLDYERTVAVAAQEGIDLETKDIIYKWTYIQAVFFSSTILTTIGYGNIAPVTVAGRLFCILFAIIGIPFTLSVIADVGQICATLVSKLWEKYKPFCVRLSAAIKRWWANLQRRRRRRRRLMQRSKVKDQQQVLPGGAAEGSSSKKGDLGDHDGDEDDEDDDEGDGHRRKRKGDDDDDDDDDDGPGGFSGNALTAIFALGFLTFYQSMGAYILGQWEQWSFLDGFYFCFITMTTIGFGDIVPGKTVYMFVCMLYTLVGLAATTTIIELVRRQYERSWQKMQELRAQIQAQLKLAATLRQMADQAGKNNIELEGIDIAGDLESLRKNIAKFKKGKYGGGLSDIEIKDLDWIDQNKRKVKAVTIFIYESSV